MQRVPAGPVDREETPDWALGIASFLPNRRAHTKAHAHALGFMLRRRRRRLRRRRYKLGPCPGAGPARARAPDGLRGMTQT